MVKHLALGSAGLGMEDAMVHLFNHVWPNVFEESPHVRKAVFEAIESMRLAVGPTYVLLHLLQGLFHPARKVRTQFWRVYNNLYCYGSEQISLTCPPVPDDVMPGEGNGAAGIEAKATEADISQNTYRDTYEEMFM